ncbi:hypothetical protein H6F74_22130 [Trichocoleus sp. FACHB-90]|uniref:hypothetical protein n=1 Tax=Cyanophyceae TaxID=3028117 RepID=UPI001683BCEB|nr:hypothetical protein [Trichocoleus sp. FACHB-90]MBD1928923.1 hypothetical protein [Trichocoleus sp. FACHB-90]
MEQSFLQKDIIFSLESICKDILKKTSRILSSDAAICRRTTGKKVKNAGGGEKGKRQLCKKHKNLGALLSSRNTPLLSNAPKNSAIAHPPQKKLAPRAVSMRSYTTSCCSWVSACNRANNAIALFVAISCRETTTA